MNNSVVIKGNKYGIILSMKKDASYEEIKDELLDKFKTASKFFDNAKMAITFQGKELTEEQENELINVIESNSEIKIVCIMDSDELKAQNFKAAIESSTAELAANSAMFHRGTLRSGQELEINGSVIIIGDVNPGANVIATGSIFIIGSLKGKVYAGAAGDETARVVALEMSPVQIRIGDVIARCEDGSQFKYKKSNEPQVAYAEKGNIVIEKLDKNVRNDILI